jgi:hypothetical protein
MSLDAAAKIGAGLAGRAALPAPKVPGADKIAKNGRADA